MTRGSRARCGGCGEFNTYRFRTGSEPTPRPEGRPKRIAPVVTREGVVVPLGDVASTAVEPKRIRTGFRKFDVVAGGKGVVEGAPYFFFGEKGSGKSTLLLQAASGLAKRGRSVLWATGEESATMMGLRARRLSVNTDGIAIVESHDIHEVLAMAARLDVLIIDSLQRLTSPTVKGRMGGLAQVMEVANLATTFGRKSGCTVILVGQVSSSGDAAGPEGVPHLVDVVLSLSKWGEDDRILTAEKNRWAPEVHRTMTMTAKGLQ